MSLPASLLWMVLRMSAPCDADTRVVLMPFERLALPSTDARELEDATRRAVAALPDACLESREDTMARLRGSGAVLAACGDAACRSAQASALGVRRMVRGVALGVGGKRSVALTVTDARGPETRAQFEAPATTPGEADARARHALQQVWSPLVTTPSARQPQGSRMLPRVLWGVGGAALLAGVGFGLAARSTESKVSKNGGECVAAGEAFADCFASRLRTGRNQARTSNVLLGAGALLGVGGAVSFIWELP
ncbi:MULTISPECIES: hypothetical protein [unclassified Corallococcus]|uniref:hypothetical protein n=1 Tax=unclassified Corallococcus TaxID=2685029 RepID=UPI001A8E27C1|nr:MULTISPECIES: hypothetical protein [unclassified Corallococcus]MBN9683174.1 hypothetical protein [Corallococcus sp. NCSPR001]WAS85300.1 hypothetical protein O0N60_39380 [Corallococcus sp. NCRR]